MSDPISVLAAVIERNGTYLLCRRPSSKRHGGFWEFPGGKLEDGESLHAAAVRELWEELRLEVISVESVIAVIDDEGSKFKIHFVMVGIPPTAVPELVEHDALAWVPRTDIGNYALAPTDAKFASTLG